MRMWMVSPKLLCTKHLLGEHVEVHMLAGSIIEGKSIEGYMQRGLVDPAVIYERHDQLAEEMTARGFVHESTMRDVDVSEYVFGCVSIVESLVELRKRCPECSELINAHNPG